MKPDKPLNLRVDDTPIDLFFDLQETFEAIATTGVTRAAWNGVKSFVASCSDWTEAELSKLNLREVVDLTRDIKLAMTTGQADAIPPETGDDSISLPTESPTVPQGG